MRKVSCCNLDITLALCLRVVAQRELSNEVKSSVDCGLNFIGVLCSYCSV